MSQMWKVPRRKKQSYSYTFCLIWEGEEQCEEGRGTACKEAGPLLLAAGKEKGGCVYSDNQRNAMSGSC